MRANYSKELDDFINNKVIILNYNILYIRSLRPNDLYYLSDSDYSQDSSGSLTQEELLGLISSYKSENQELFQELLLEFPEMFI